MRIGINFYKHTACSVIAWGERHLCVLGCAGLYDKPSNTSVFNAVTFCIRKG